MTRPLDTVNARGACSICGAPDDGVWRKFMAPRCADHADYPRSRPTARPRPTTGPRTWKDRNPEVIMQRRWVTEYDRFGYPTSAGHWGPWTELDRRPLGAGDSALKFWSELNEDAVRCRGREAACEYKLVWYTAEGERHE